MNEISDIQRICETGPHPSVDIFLTTNLRVGRSNRSGRAISSTGKQGLGKTGRPLGVGLFRFSKHMVTPRADLASGRAPLDGPNRFSADDLFCRRALGPDRSGRRFHGRRAAALIDLRLRTAMRLKPPAAIMSVNIITRFVSINKTLLIAKSPCVREQG